MSETPRTDAVIFISRGMGIIPTPSKEAVRADFARDLERELAAAKDQWRMSSVCRELSAKLEAERALADRLAALLLFNEGEVGDEQQPTFTPSHVAALAAWKASRDEQKP
jgi:hypothetical protein